MKKSIIFLILIVSSFCFGQADFQKDLASGIEKFNNSDFDKAKKVFEDLYDKNENSAEVNFYLGYTLFKINNLENLDDAIEYLEKAVELEPNNIEYNFRLAQLYGIDAREASIFRVMSVASSMKEQLLKTLELDQNHIEARIYLANFYLQAPGIAGGDIEQALIEANKIVTINEMRGRVLLAQIYLELEEIQKAENEFKTVENKFGDDPKIFNMYNTYGYFLVNQNRLDEAITKFEKQIKLAPDNANAHDSLGEAYKLKGQLHKSLEAYKKALEINPNLKSSKVAVEEIQEQLNQ